MGGLSATENPDQNKDQNKDQLPASKSTDLLELSNTVVDGADVSPGGNADRANLSTSVLPLEPDDLKKFFIQN